MVDRTDIFPKIEKSLVDFINDEDGNITRNRLVSIGSMILLMSILSFDDVFAAHSSHSSHVSHTSHSSTSYIRDHTNHSSHSDHQSHSSHSSHTSHSNTSSHSNSAYSEEGDVDYGPKVEEIPQVEASPRDNSSIINTPDAAEAGTTRLSMNLPEQPDISDVAKTGETGLDFDNNTAVDVLGYAAAAGGVAAVAAGAVGSAKIGIDKVKEKKRADQLKKSAQTYFDEYTDDSIDKKITELKEVGDLESNRVILEQLSYERVIESSGLAIDDCLGKIEELQKAIDNKPKQADSIERFASYYIPETIGIIMTYVQYVQDNAPEDDMYTVYYKAKESLDALTEAISEKIDNIYQFTTMETVAKAEALNEILANDGYKQKQ